MSDIDNKIVSAIVGHGGAVSLFELMSLVGDVADSEVADSVKRLEKMELVKVKSSSDPGDPLITIKEKELERLEDVA